MISLHFPASDSILQISGNDKNVREKTEFEKNSKNMLTFRLRYSIVLIVPVSGTQQNATVAQLVEYDLAKVGVAGSNPVCRSELST